MITKAVVGTIIHATMRTEDLIPCFLAELERLDSDNKKFLTVIAEGKEIIKNEDWDSDNTISYLMEALWYALDSYSPEGCYFGCTEGDGSDYGYWPLPPEEDCDGCENDCDECEGSN